MFKKLTLLTVLFIFWEVSLDYAYGEIRFHVPDFPPYTFEKDGKIQGIGVDLVDKVMKETTLEYSLTFVSNYERIVFNVKTGKADGFFLASRNIKRDNIAVMSKPLTINRWCWFLLPDSSLNPADANFKTEARVGTFLNANTHKWLEKKGYHVTGSPNNVDSLLKMLKANRINCVFLSEQVFYEIIRKAGEKPDNYKKVIQVEKPFGIYIAKSYLSNHPDVMEKINAAISKTINIKN